MEDKRDFMNEETEYTEVENTSEETDAPEEAEKASEKSADSSQKKTINTVINIVLIIILTLIVLVLGFFGVKKCIEHFGVDTSVATPDEVVTTEPVTEETEPESTVPTEPTDPTMPNGQVYNLVQDWDMLKDINNEIVGWIDLPGTSINHPVLKHDGDGVGYQYYIHKNYDRSYLFAGSIFIDYRSSQGVNSRNIITHGHNMDDGSMYGALMGYGKYTPNMDYYRSYPTLFFNTPKGNEQWVIFAVYKTNTLSAHGDFFNYLMGDFSSDAQFMNYIYNVKCRSLIDVPVPINENDQIITLSTCSYEYTEFRTVVVARKVRPGESVASYVNAAKAAKNPLWPDVHYSGNTKPEVTTFKTEYQKGNISWYDGSGELKGSEWLQNVAGNKTYTVTFIDRKGNILSTQTVPYGKDATPPPDPKDHEDEYYIYKFIGWGLPYTNVTANMTIAPEYEPILKER